MLHYPFRECIELFFLSADAIESFQTCLRIEPKNVVCWRGLAECYRKEVYIHKQKDTSSYHLRSSSPSSDSFHFSSHLLSFLCSLVSSSPSSSDSFLFVFFSSPSPFRFYSSLRFYCYSSFSFLFSLRLRIESLKEEEEEEVKETLLFRFLCLSSSHCFVPL